MRIFSAEAALEMPEIFSPQANASPHAGTFRSKSVFSGIANDELATGTEDGLNERWVGSMCVVVVVVVVVCLTSHTRGTMAGRWR